MKYIYGPVKSRRLGLSLGVSLTAYKICDFDCVYCQLGSTKILTQERREYASTQDIMAELQSWLRINPQEAQKLSYITLSGLGEPTLNIKLGEFINTIKRLATIPVAVITNASLLADPAVRLALLEADLIVPSLDASSQKTFLKINRPAPSFKIEQIIDGLVSLRKEFKGIIWLEIMIIRGINDDPAEIQGFKDAIQKIKPDKIQLNSPVRSTAQEGVLPAEKEKLEEMQSLLGANCEIL